MSSDMESETWRYRQCYISEFGPGRSENRALIKFSIQINSLGPNPSTTPPINSRRLPNTTNLHTHGLHISPLIPQDNVFVDAGPGESLQYSYQIGQDHPPGTYWYHPHTHGSGELQIGGGMTGLIIVEDNVESTPKELRDVSCPENCQHDIPFIFQGILKSSYVDLQADIQDDLRQSTVEITGGGNLDDWLKDNINYATTNGQLMPLVEITQGQMERFRLVNTGPLSVVELELVPVNDSTSGCDIREIAIDGVYLDEPRAQRHGQSLILQSGRMDWLVRCDDAGLYELKTTPRTVHDISVMTARWPEQVLATIKVVKGDSPVSTMDFPEELPTRPPYIGDLRGASVDQTIVLELTEFFSINRDRWSGPTDYRYKMEVETVIEVQLVSTIPSFSHPMHIHTHHAQVIGYEKYVGPWAANTFLDPVFELYDQKRGEACYYQHRDHTGSPNLNLTDPLRMLGHETRWNSDGNFTLGYPQAGEWRDVFLVQSLANITLRMKLQKFTGPLLFHCHLLDDSDRGMMLVMEVVEEGGNLSGARIDSDGAFPGSCERCEWNMFKDIPSDCNATTPVTTTAATRIAETTTATTTVKTTTTTSHGKQLRPSSYILILISVSVLTTGILLDM